MAAKYRAKKEQWQAEMIDVAEKLFLLRGYDGVSMGDDGVSMGDIAREAGFYEATLRLFFRDKESLYFAVAMRGMHTLSAMYVGHRKSEADGLSELASLGRSIREFSRRYPDDYRMLYAKDTYYKRKGGMPEAVMSSVEGEAIKNDLGPTEIALYLIVLSIGAIRADPRLKAALASAGIDCERFAGNLPLLIGHVMEERRKAAIPGYAGMDRRRGGCKNS